MTREIVTDPRLGMDEQSFTKGERTIEKNQQEQEQEQQLKSSEPERKRQ